MLKNLVKNLKPSSTLAINETSRELEKKGKKYLNLVLDNHRLWFHKMLLMN